MLIFLQNCRQTLDDIRVLASHESDPARYKICVPGDKFAAWHLVARQRCMQRCGIAA
jgi:hypothetical protein